MNKVFLKTPAKVNLFLEIVSKRKDGYHNLLTVFGKVSLFDELIVKKSPVRGIDIVLKKSPVKIKKKNNLVYKAVSAFFSEFNIKGEGVKIILKKYIPAGAGLGGGSSDAAAALKGLCAVFNIDFNANFGKLLKIGQKLGADAPVFLFNDSFCEARGKGEKLKPIPNQKRNDFLLLVYPPKPMSTKEAYSALKLPSKKEISSTKRKFAAVKKSVLKGESFKGALFNRLEYPVFSIRRDIAKNKAKMEKLGADSVLMSGSGSCIFGIFSNRKAALKAFRAFSACKNKVFLSKFL